MGTLDGKIALVAGARTRDRGRVCVLHRPQHTRAQRSEMDRPETIEETVEIIEREGGRGAAVQVDHLDPKQVEALVIAFGADVG